MIYGVILAGGEGKRMGGNIPKQYLELSGRPIFIWTIDVFLKSDLFDKIYLTINEDWHDFTYQTLKKFYSFKDLKKIELCISQCKNRTLSLMETINSISLINGYFQDNIIVSHDAVRPFVSYKILKDCINKTLENGVAMAAVPCTETLYLSNSEEFLNHSHDRSKCYAGQSPLGCNLGLIYSLLNSYSEEELKKATAISQLFINRNINVKLSYGEDTNFKITTPKDLIFARFYAENLEKRDNSNLK